MEAQKVKTMFLTTSYKKLTKQTFPEKRIKNRTQVVDIGKALLLEKKQLTFCLYKSERSSIC